MAISATTVAFMIGGDLIMKDGVQVAYTKIPLVFAILIALGVSIFAGAWNGMCD